VRDFRWAMCNEAFGETPFAESCSILRKSGYTGIEIAPFTLAPSPRDVSARRRQELKAIMASEGLTFVGLHWLMPSPPGLHVTTPDDALRERSWAHVRDLVELCADLGPNGVMVFGSPKQRSTTGGSSREEAMQRFTEGIARVAPHAEAHGVTVLVEPLPPDQCDVMNTLEEAVTIVRTIGSPAVSTMFDTHNAVDESAPHPELVDRHFGDIRHVHVNELDGSHPRPGLYPFAPLFDTLERRGYQGWVSLEAFDFDYGGERIARETIDYLKVL
jgi:D-psicose/D-tagatose/L-ribulose 3-epimerase